MQWRKRGHLKDKNWILSRFFSQRDLSTVPTPIHMVLPTLKVHENLLFVTLRVNNNSNNRNLPSPPEEVVGADESDYQSCVAPGGRLLSFYQVWKKNEEIEAILCFAILGKNSKIQNGRHMWEEENF